MICPVLGTRCESSGCSIYIDGRCALKPVTYYTGNPASPKEAPTREGMPEYPPMWSSANEPLIKKSDYDALRAYAERLQTENERMSGALSGDASFLHAEARDGNLTMGLAHPLVGVLADSLAKQIGDNNYVEMRMKHKTNGEEYCITCQRLSRPTPHEKRLEAERERDRLAERLQSQTEEKKR